MSDFAREAGLVFTQDGHTRGSVAYARELGILGPHALLSHSTALTDEEIAIVADTGTHIVHNPSAVASILARCPVTELLEAGANVCLGSDATAPDRSGDMFRHMQQCMHYHRTFHHDPSWLPPGRVLEMCTVDAARALGMADEIGSLEVGKKADVVLLDWRRPHLYPANMPLFRLVYFANGNDVDTVIVDGRIALRRCSTRRRPRRNGCSTTAASGLCWRRRRASGARCAPWIRSRRAACRGSRRTELRPQGAGRSGTPSRATMRPRFRTRRFGERLTTASASVSPGRISRSAAQPSASP